jgi:S1-C subfamily serine protease
MRTWTRPYVLLAAIALVFSATIYLPSHADEAPSAETVYQNVSGSIYEVYSDDMDNTNGWAYGSAVAIENTLLATNCHIALSGSFIMVKVNKKPYLGRLFYYNQKRDLCIVEVVGVKLKPVHIRHSDTVKIGEQVFAIGNPLELSQSISEGIISNKINDDGITILQTDASISHGSSGGGLFDKNSNLIGITTSFHKENPGITFAIPTELILEVLEPGNTSTPSTAKPDEQLQPTQVVEVKHFYGTEISNKDRFNTHGIRLTKIKEILRQDRANFYLSYTQDKNDEKDSFFSTKEKREMFDTAKIKISNKLAEKILGDNPVLITVFVTSPNEIIVKEGLPEPGN